jgi:hypothetical protein
MSPWPNPRSRNKTSVAWPPRASRACWSVLIALTAAACSSTGELPTSVSLSTGEPPDAKVWLASAQNVYKAYKMTGNPSVSPLRRAPPISPGDWILCLRSDDFPHPAALFFNGQTLTNFRLAVAVDDCGSETYMPIEKPP